MTQYSQHRFERTSKQVSKKEVHICLLCMDLKIGNTFLIKKKSDILNFRRITGTKSQSSVIVNVKTWVLILVLTWTFPVIWVSYSATLGLCLTITFPAILWGLMSSYVHGTWKRFHSKALKKSGRVVSQIAFWASQVALVLKNSPANAQD